MEDFKQVSAALGHRIQAIADRDGIPPNQIATRYTCERIVDEKNWQRAFGPAPTMLKGGLLVDNATRPTLDADIQSVRSYTDDELLRGMMVIKDLLRSDGIDIVDARVRHIGVGYGDPISRLAFTAKTGGLRVNSQVDISSGWGKDAFPAKEDIHPEVFPSFATKSFQFPTYTARRQPLESQLAEKWLAVATQLPTDLRMKNHADIVLFHSQDVDLKKLGEEIMRVLRYRGIPPVVFTSGIHYAIQRVEILKRSSEWEKVRAERPSTREFAVDQILSAIASTYRCGVYAAFVRARDKGALVDFRRHRDAPRLPVTAPVDIPEGSNVVAFRR